jgi:heat shock protein HslJ
MRATVLSLALIAACAPQSDLPARDTTSAAPAPAPANSTAAAPTAASSDSTGEALVGRSWRWVRIVTPVETIEAPSVGKYTLQLGDSNRISGVADCNRIMGKYTLAGTSLSIGPLGMTRMACPPGGMGGRYSKWLNGASGFFFRADTLFIDLKVDSGTMRFVPEG